MSTSENRAIIESFYEASNVGDLDTLMGLFSPDIVWTNIGTTHVSGRFEGLEKFTTELLGPVFSKLKGGIVATVDNVIAEGDWVVVQVRGTAETVDGRPYNNTYCHVFRLAEGKIVEVTEYFDTQLAAEALR